MEKKRILKKTGTIKIGFDCDDVLLQCSEHVINTIKEKEGVDLEFSKLTHWGYSEGEYKRIYKYFSDVEFVSSQPLIQGAKEFIKKLSEIENIEIYFITAVPAKMMGIRAEALKKHFPFINERNFILTSSKDVCDFDIFVDDNPHNIFKNKSEFRIVRRQPWNQNITGMLTFSNFDELYTIIHHILTKKGHIQNENNHSNIDFIAIVGPSGSGKNELLEKINKKINSNNKVYKHSPKAKHRKIYSGAIIRTHTNNPLYKDVKGYCYDVDFDKKEKLGLYESVSNYGFYKYGFLKSRISSLQKYGLTGIVVSDIGNAMALKSKYNTLIIYKDVPEEKTIRKITKVISENSTNTDIVNHAINRLMALQSEKSNVDICDYIIDKNANIKESVDCIMNIIKKQKES